MNAPVVRPWQWQDHPTRWAPGDQVNTCGILWERNSSNWQARGAVGEFSGSGYDAYALDAHVDEWIMCGLAVPLVEHGNPIVQDAR